MINATVLDNINNFTAEGKAKSKTDKASDSLFSNYQDFVKLLTVQLENQDPTKPLETDQLTSQIAQLSSVEQQINTNKNLEKILASFSQNQVTQNVSYIGKMVEATGNLGALIGGQGIFVYNLKAPAATTQVQIVDQSGNVVYSRDGTNLAGRNTFVWDGKNNQGQQVQDGTYAITVSAKDASGKVVEAQTSTAGRVTSVETIDGTTYVAVGDVLIPQEQIFSVREMPTIL